MDFIILPHQLFDIKYLNKKNSYILWEHQQYFTKYKFNKKKLILHRASMKSYYDYLLKNGFKVKYIEYEKKYTKTNLDKLGIKRYKIYNPIDKIKLYNKYEILETPNLLLTTELCNKYREKTKSSIFNNFYMWSKKELDILPGVKSQDKDNRKRLPKNILIPKLINKKKNKYINEAINYVNKNFKKNYGNTNNFYLPIDHKTALKWLKDFIKNKFEKFGDYQDFIKKGNEFLFHSVLSSSINIGLLNPINIIKEIKKYKNKIPLNSYEGYIRQLFWREYQRYIYIFYDLKSMNYFNHNKKLNKKWYNGTLNIPPIDDAIKTGFNLGYLHHINRLMVMGNYMNLNEISPMEGFRWFMEFSCDSYEWVMCQNVLDMVFFVSGGKTMTRPYISSSNYILKMSDYKKDKWCQKWDELYHNFKINHKNKLWKFRYYFPGLKNL